MVDIHGLEIPEPPEKPKDPENPGEEYHEAIREWVEDLRNFRHNYGELSPAQAAAYIESLNNEDGQAAGWYIGNLPDQEINEILQDMPEFPPSHNPSELLQNPSPEHIAAVKDRIDRMDSLEGFTFSDIRDVIDDVIDDVREFMGIEDKPPQIGVLGIRG